MGLRLQAAAVPAWAPPPSRASPQWDTAFSNPTDGTTAAALVISPSDPAFSACPACTLLCINASLLYHPPGASANTFASAALALALDTPQGGPQVLTLGLPTPPITAGVRSIHTFLLWLDTPDSDLAVTVTALSGVVAFTLDAAPASLAACAIARPSNAISCSGTWARGSSGTLHVAAAAPCASANAGAAVPCNAARDWAARHGRRSCRRR